MKTLLESLLDDEDIIIDKFNREEVIRNWLKENCFMARRFTINEDWTVDVKGDVNIINDSIISLPINLFKFGTVTGHFSTTALTHLKTLEGSPIKCNSFDCSYCNSLTSLQGCPKNCKKFWCNNCTNLKNIKDWQNQNCLWFSCDGCPSLESLEGSPTKCDLYDCSDCISIKNLDGCPKECNSFICSRCSNLKSLKGAPIKCHKITCSKCPIKTLEGLPQYCDELIFEYVNLESLDDLPKCIYCTATKSRLNGKYIEFEDIKKLKKATYIYV